MYKSTGDEQWKIASIIWSLKWANAQDALGDGYLSAFPSSYFDRLESGEHVWAPYYTVHKIMAGLLQAYQLCGNEQALEMDKKMAGYFDRRLSRLSPEQIERIFHTSGSGPGTEFGGMSEVLHDLYGITGDPETLRLANLFDRDWLAVPLAEGEDRLAGLHANTHIPQVDGFAALPAHRRYKIPRCGRSFLGDRHRPAFVRHRLQQFFRTLRTARRGSQPTFADHRRDVQHIQHAQAHATSVRMDPKPQYADYYERALYNHILASIDPQTGMMMYFLSLAPGHFKVYCTPTESFWCCTGTGVENHAKYGDSIYFHDNATLWVNLFIPSVLNWREKGITLRQETKYPEEEGTTLIFQMSQPTQLAVNLRVPYWATHGVTVKVNGQPQEISAAPRVI